MIQFISTDENRITPFASMTDIIGLKIYTFHVLGLELPSIKYLNEIGIATDDDFGTYNNKIVNGPPDFDNGILGASELIHDLSKLPADIPEIMKELVDALVSRCLEVVSTNEEVYLA